MKKLLLAVCAAGALAMNAQAISYSATNVHNEYLSENEVLSGSFNVPNNFGAGATVTDAELIFSFYAGLDLTPEWVRIKVGDMNALTTELDLWEDITIQIVGNTLAGMQPGGSVSYQIKQLNRLAPFFGTEDSRIIEVTLNANVDVPVASVPDEGLTVILLGSAMIGLFVLHRRGRAGMAV